MQRDKSEITRKVVETQKRHMLKGDFYTQVKSDMDQLRISEVDIVTRNESQLKLELTSRIQKAAYEYLIEKARNHSKTRTELYKDLNGSSYLSDHRFTPDLVLIFAVGDDRG